MMSEDDNIGGRLEPGVSGSFSIDSFGVKRPLTAEETAALSQAISLRRIADAIVGDAFNTGIRKMIGDIADRTMSA